MKQQAIFLQIINCQQNVWRTLLTSYLALFTLMAAASETHQDILLSQSTSTIGDQKTVRIIEPKKDVPVAKAAAIDDERFELGLFTGLLAVEDFNTNPVLGISFTYHINPRFIAQLNYGSSEVGKSSSEKFSSTNFLTQRDFTYYNALAGYRLLRGRSFFGKNTKYNSDIFLLAGFGSVDFAGESNTSLVLGTSYRVVLTDSLVANIDFRGHSFDRDLLGDSKSTFNTEFALGLNFLF
jgi:outer membrane beta-barrel protein